MPLTAVKPSQVRKISANSLVGNNTGAEARGTSLSASQVRTLLGLGTADSPSFSGLTLSGHLLFNATNTYDIGNGTYDPRTVRAATSLRVKSSVSVGTSSFGAAITDTISTDNTVSGAAIVVHATDATTRFQIGQGSSTYSFGTWMQSSYDNGGGGTVGRLFLNPIGGRVSIGNSTTDYAHEILGGNTLPSVTSGTGDGVFTLKTLSQNLSFGHYQASPFGMWVQAKGSNAALPLVLQPLGGPVVIGATTNDGSGNLLQVAGGISATSLVNQTAALTLGNSTYGVTVPGDAIVGDNTSGQHVVFSDAITAAKFGVSAKFGASRVGGWDADWTTGECRFGGFFANYYPVLYSNGTACLSFTTGGAATFSGNVTISGYTYANGGFAQQTSGVNRYAVSTVDLGSSQFYTATGLNMLQAGSSYDANKQGGGIYFDDRTGVAPIRLMYHGVGTTAVSEALGISATGNSTFSGDISMAKTSAQGYIRAYNTAGTGNAWLTYLNTEVQIGSTNNGAIRLETASAQVFRSGSSCDLRVYDSTVSKYSALTHDGTNGILSTSSGALDMRPASGLAYIYSASANADFRVYKSNGIDYAQMKHDGTNSIFSGSTGETIVESTQATKHIRLSAVTGITYAYKAGVNSEIEAVGSAGVNCTYMTHNNTTGTIGTNSGNLNLVPTGGTVAVTGGITASGAISAGTAVNGLPGIGGTTFLSGKSGTFEFSVQDYASGNGYIGTYNGTVKGITGYTTTSDPRVIYGTTSDHDVMLWRNSTAKMRVYSAYVEFANTIKTTAGLLSGAFVGYTGSNGATGSCEVASVSGTGPVYLWTEYGLGVRGCLGYTAGSTTLSYRAAGSSMTTGTEVFTIGSTGNVGCGGITASGNVSYAQGLSTGTVTKSANYTTTADDYCVNVTANSIDITFETAVGCANREHEVINSGSGVVTLKTTSAQTISGSASGALTLAQYKAIRVKSDGANWLIMSQIT